QIRQPAAQSKLRELRQRARSACFVPVMQKMQNNRNFTLSPENGINGKSRLVNLVLLPLWYGNKDIIRDNISKCHR
ncbi:hypothetical protein, partial [Segatella hominis]|uniref:hypothetical protein n=1 Tax=Segatella hominis TaxID=2518605 RepID=UPI003AB75048